MPISLDSNHLETVKRILELHFNGLEVLAYGSRVSGVNLTPDADLDIVVVSEKPISLEDMISVEQAFAESGLPFRVDIVDWAKLPESIQKAIKKENEVIQEAE
ncbi:MAG: nucleotidyltransferase domain-containing protein [Fibrobacteraceae bacterium]|jgi:predicted nucleotidyltransferase|nr:nucleotidyltransferase domain-containing protein [Fibrobacteraceae bacterium]MEE1277239.1 nucleotidyltransferase domain-containing protein [Fibrobacteraceae bacterium]